jgi:hypothetical protein
MKFGRKKPLIALAVLMIAAAGFWLFSSWASGPVSVSPTEPVAAAVAATETIPPVAISTPYYTSQMPGQLSVKSNNTQQQGPLLAQFLASSKQADMTHAGDQLAITVGQAPASGLPGTSEISYRSHYPDLYSKSSLDFVPAGAIVYTRQDPYEIGVFWLHGPRYVALVASGAADRSDSLKGSLKMVLDKWEWK